VTAYASPRQLRRLLDAVTAVSSELDLPAVLQHIVEAARDLVGARYAALGVLDPTQTYLSEFITTGLDAAQVDLIGTLPKGHGVLGLMIVDPRPIRIADLGEHPDRFGFPPHHPPMRGFLGVPLFVRGEVFGNLYLTDKLSVHGFSDIDEELAVALAAAAAVAIDKTRLQRRATDLSVLADRERIASDLHDTVVQRLFATGLAMQGTAQMADRREMAARLQEHIDDLDQTIREVRSAIFQINAARSPGSSLRRDVLDLVAESARVLGFDPSVCFDGPVDTVVAASVAAHVLPVLREALSNVARHAHATEVAVTVRADSDLSLEVADDGTGISATGRDGNGLRNMARRAVDLGGHAKISPGAVRGTTVHWVVPL